MTPASEAMDGVSPVGRMFLTVQGAVFVGVMEDCLFDGGQATARFMSCEFFSFEL
jgi:hypothetical protein